MKKLLLSLILWAFGFVAYSQTWVEMMHNPSANFYETQAEFNAYWENRTIEKGKGYKQFRRWEDFLEPRVYPRGDVKVAFKAYEEFVKYQRANPSYFVQNQNRSTGNWTVMGPIGAPTSGGGAGRINFIRFMPGNTNTMFAGSPAGGLWKTTDGGSTWTTNTDQLTVIGCSDIAIDPANTDVMYLATGDGDAADTYSIGVLKSTDGGATWNTTGLSWTVDQGRRISKLLIHPSNSQIILAATSNGVYRTTNGGTSWTQVRTGNFKDMEFKPGDPNTVYVSGTTFFKSINNGQNWTQITSGLPTTGVSRMAIAVTPANPDYVYMIVGRSSDQGLLGVYRSTDNGTTFTQRTGTSPNLLGWNNNGGDAGGQAWFDLAIAVSETNADVVVVGGVNIWRSTNGGTSWAINGHWTGSGAPYVHADIHDLIFLPGSGTTYFSGNDGGVFKTTNSGTAWSDISANLTIAQQYRIGLSSATENLLVSGHQDNGTNKMSGTAWSRIYGGDGMDCFIDRANDSRIIASYVYGDFKRSTNGGASWTTITTGLTGTAAWNAPIHQDPVTVNTFFCGYQHIFKSTNSGTNWTQLTALPLATGSVVEFAIAPSNVNYIYVVKSNNFFKSTNGGTSWTTHNTGLPIASAAITNLAIHPTNPDVVWVTFSGYSSGNKVFMTTNGGTSWTNYSTGLPNLPANCIVYQNNTSDGLYVGTDVGVYYRDNTLSTWQPYMTGLPNVVVTDLEIYYPTLKLRAATFGRGTWQSDCYAPLTSAPLANFTANKQVICPGQSVSFTDISSFNPTSWSWTFAGGTPTASTQQHPTVTYASAGTYQVSLTVTNANGNNTKTEVGYITVSSPQTLPLVEGFQGSFLPANWTLMDVNSNGITWTHSTSAGGFGTSSSSVVFDNFTNNENGARDELWTPKYNFSSVSSATMTFDVAYARYNATYSDTLAVMVSTDCGLTWSQVFLKGGSTLSTRTDLTTLFVPTNTQWRTETVSLTSFAGQGNVLIAFQNRGRYGNAIYLDNINITGVVTVPAPDANFSVANTTVCVGQTVSFTDISTNTPTSWSWTFAGGTPTSSTVQNPTVNYSAAGTYAVSLVASNASGSDTETKNGYITVVANPTATAGSNSPLCAGSALNLSTPAVTGATYSWTGPGGYTATTRTPSRANVTTAMAGTYTVTVSANGCSSTSSVTVVINASPLATASSNTPVCAGNTINLTTTAVTGATYSWTGPSSFTATTQSPSRANATTAMAGTYSVTVTANGCSATSTTSVAVNNLPTASATANGPLCEGATLNLSTTAVTGATYAWSGPGGYTATTRTPARTNVTLAMAGTYSVTVTANGCSNTSTVAVVINPAPGATASSNSPVCTGSDINLTTPAVSGATYSWTGPNSFASTAQSPVRSNATAAMAGTYTVTVTANGCTSTSSATIAVNSTPVASASSNGPICEGATLNLSTTAVTGATYAWTGPGGYTATTRTPSRTNSTAAMSGNYTVTVTANGCSNTSTVSVVINAAPSALASSNSTVCVGNDINLTTLAVSGATYSWVGPNSFTSNAQSPVRSNATIAMAGTYTVTVSANGCTSTSSTSVIVNSIPTVSAAANSPICEGNTLNLTCSNLTGATYSWIGPNSFSSNLQNPSLLGVTTASSGLYTVTALLGGCLGSGTVNVTINAGPTSIASSNSPLCEGETIELATPTITGATYSWTGPNGYVSSQAAPSIVNASLDMTGDYLVTVMQGGCSTTSTVEVTVNDVPELVLANNGPLCEGENLQLTAPNIAGATYQWSGPNGFMSSLQSPIISDVNSLNSGVYTLQVNNGCPISDNITVIVNDNPELAITSNSPLCTGNTMEIDVNSVQGAYYSWSGPNGFNATSSSVVEANISLDYAGIYLVEVIDEHGCVANESVLIEIELGAPANASSNSPICAGEALTLSTPLVDGATYLWSGPNGFSSILQNPVLFGTTTLDAGMYSVSVATANCTSSATLSTTQVDIYSTPAMPVITNSSGVLVSSVASGNQWYLDGLPISGATSQMYTPTVAGIYSVVVTLNGCSSGKSNDVIIDFSSVQENRQTAFELFPNPSDGTFIMILDVHHSGSCVLEMHNAIGQRVYFEEIGNVASQQLIKNYSFTNMNRGIYFFKVTIGEETWFKKVVIQ
jgi:PKD repeat protein